MRPCTVTFPTSRNGDVAIKAVTQQRCIKTHWQQKLLLKSNHDTTELQQNKQTTDFSRGNFADLI